MMGDEKIKVDKVSRNVIEGCLLESLDDGEHVAIVLSKGELDTLIRALWVVGSEKTDSMRSDLEKLRREAFGCNPPTPHQ